ncbi:MAG: two-component sensor histidine kinase, partial [Acetatifactor sp.]|nr:two-component sensor histidine kinase [Acetatifactor sp.]
MKSVPKLIRRFVSIMLLSSVLLIILNFVLLAVYTVSNAPNAYPWKTAEEVADNLLQNENGYSLSENVSLELKNSNVWAIFIDNKTMQVVWQTDNLPETIPMSYSVSDIASLTRGYIDGYPTFTGEAENGLVVLGYPKDRFW